MAALESIVVALLVTTCAIFSLWRLLSVRMRLRVLELLAGLPASAGGYLVARLHQKTLAKLSAGGCGACSRAVGSVNATFPPVNRRPAAPPR